MRFKSIRQLRKSCLSKDAIEQVINKYEKTCNRNTGVPADRKRNIAVAETLQLEILESQRFVAPVRVFIHSIRNRLPDMDNISGKAVLDAIVNLGILQDDSKKWIPEQPRHTSEVGKEEKTVITIETI